MLLLQRRVRFVFLIVLLLLLISPFSFAKFQDFEVENYQIVELDESLQSFGGPEIIVNIPARKLYLFDDGEMVQTYPVAVGSRRHKTPIGSRKMTHWVWNPWWIPPKKSEWAKDAKNTPPGKYNPLGPVKMKLGGAIMFHGTDKPHTVGKVASHGCLRMYNQNAIDLAKYIQKRMTRKSDESYFDLYKQKSRKSFAVMPVEKIPVNIIYELASLNGPEITIYKDVYSKIKNKNAHLKKLLKDMGYELTSLDEKYLSEKIHEAHQKLEVTFPVDFLFVTANKRSELLKKEILGSKKIASLQ